MPVYVLRVPVYVLRVKACMCIAGLILEEAAMFGEVGQGVVFRVGI